MTREREKRFRPTILNKPIDHGHTEHVDTPAADAGRSGGPGEIPVRLDRVPAGAGADNRPEHLQLPGRADLPLHRQNRHHNGDRAVGLRERERIRNHQPDHDRSGRTGIRAKHVGGVSGTVKENTMQDWNQHPRIVTQFLNAVAGPGSIH